MSGVLEFRALGPLAVLRDGAPVELGKGNERTLIALLVLHADRPLSNDTIIDALWGEQPPPTAPEMVRNYVARVRKRLGEDAIATMPSGYRLVADPDAVDLLRFERLGKEGAQALESGNPDAALQSLEEALALWSGRPLPELDSRAAGRDEIGRLEELRLQAIEGRMDAELTLGRSGTLVPELEQLVREHPHRERLLGQLMLALYRCGRQKDALERYQAGRRLLVEKAGLEPAPALQELQLAILRHDPKLGAVRRSDNGGHRPARRAMPSRRTIMLTASAAAVLATAVVVALVLFGGSSGPIVLSIHSLGAVDPQSGTAVGSLKLGSSPGPLAVAADAVWLGAGPARAVVKVDPTTFRALQTVHLPAIPYSLAAGRRSLWVGNGFDGTLTRVENGRSSRPFRPQPRSTGRLSLAYGLGSVWVGSQDDTVIRLDPRTDRAVDVVRGVSKPEAIAIGSGSVWVAEATRDVVARIDPRTNHVVREIPIGGVGTDIAVGDSAVWVVTPGEGRLWRIDPRTNAITASIAVGEEPTSVVTTNAAVWVASPQGTLTSVDPQTNLIDQTVRLGKPIADLASGHGIVWITLR